MARKKRAIDRKTKIGDIIVVALVLAASVVSVVLIARAGAGERGSAVVVEVNGKQVMRLGLSADRRVTVRGWRGPSTVEVKGRRVRMLSSTCRDKICVATGWAGGPGKSIVCLPNRVVIRVSGGRKPGRVDAVTE